MDKTCIDCLFSRSKTITEGHTSLVCAYPVPAYLVIHGSGGNFINGYEAQSCQLYKTREDMIKDEVNPPSQT